MTRLALLLAALSSPAAAGVTLAPADGEGGHVADLIVLNRQTGGVTEVEPALPLGDGLVVVVETMSPNAPGGCCPDTVSIISLPADIVAEEIDAVVEEGQRLVIRLFLFNGM